MYYMMSLKSFLSQFGRATLIGILLFLMFQAVYYFTGVEISLDSGFWRDFLFHMIFSWIIYMSNAVFIAYVLRRFGPAIFKWRNLALCILGNALVSLVAIFVSRALIFSVILGVEFDVFLSGERANYYSNSLIIAIVISVVFYAIYYYKNRQETRVKQQKIIARSATARFDALKNQLDPHFLFNSLNVLTSLIDEDPSQATRFTTSLSKVYRYVLEQKNKELVPIEEEYAFARTYVRLLKMRFEDSIIFEIPEESATPDAKIVPLSLQLLLENAVKHNVVTSGRPLTIKVEERDGKVLVSNNLQEKEVVKKSSGVGLENIRQRYALLSERQVEIRKTRDTFEVALPMLTHQVAVAQTSAAFIKDKRYEKAKEKLEAIKNFYGNLTAYCLVIPFLAWLNWRSSDFPWAIFPAVGWGFGLVMHGLEAYGYNPLFGKRWEERKIRELMDREDF
ncbi:Histidine kinase [Robiginitalea myxolifaciens]|uniref:Histidine kinase n=2 Tax=Robiginitalea myxolifaciens TaxID=400055 RepID=A0A1I6FMW0_9FLAO|nr:Histidine kinase [Robiginitalea myxolifaciens]